MRFKMYSGQEIVSQEKCRLLLAKFYEGIVCIDYKSNTTDNPVLSLTLHDAQTAIYDRATMTLATVNFSVRPLIIEDDTDFAYLFAAEIPEDTTGLEVIMFADEYRKIRIMPLYLVRTCNSYNWSWTVPPGIGGDDDPFTWSYIKMVCSEDGYTKVTYEGELDSFGGGDIVLVGNKFVEPTVMTLTFHDAPISFTDAVHTVWDEEIPILDANEIQVGTTIKHHGTIEIPTEADKAHIVGSYETDFLLRPCSLMNDPRIFNNLMFCYDSETQSTRLVFPNKTIDPKLLPDADGWYYLGDLRVRPV